MPYWSPLAIRLLPSAHCELLLSLCAHGSQSGNNMYLRALSAAQSGDGDSWNNITPSSMRTAVREAKKVMNPSSVCPRFDGMGVLIERGHYSKEPEPGTTATRKKLLIDAFVKATPSTTMQADELCTRLKVRNSLLLRPRSLLALLR